MPFSIAVDLPNRLAIVTMTGTLDLGVAFEMANAARAVAAEHDLDLIYDLRAAHTVISMTGLFEFPQKLLEHSEQGDRQFLAAHIINSADRLDDWVLYESTATRLGMRIKLFYAEDHARAWIADERAKSSTRGTEPARSTGSEGESP